MDFNPTERIHKLLGPSPIGPWPALIPQILLWCFRRFCIEKLMAFDAALYDSIWEDHMELVQRYCPKGLEQASIDWMTPENIETLHSSLKDYNRYFTDFIIQLDAVVLSDDYATQDQLSEFLDTKMPGIISKWVAGSPFLIFPTEAGKDDEFTQEQLSVLIKSLLKYLSEAPAPVARVVKPVEPEPPVLPSNSLLWKYLCNPIMLPRVIEDLPPPPPYAPPYEPPQHYEQHYEPPQHYEQHYEPPQHYEQPYQPPQHYEQHYEPPQHYEQHYEPQQQYEQPYQPQQQYEQPYQPPQHYEQHYEPPQPYEQPYEQPQEHYEQPQAPPQVPPQAPPQVPPQEPPRQVARAMVYRRTMRKKHRLSRVKTCKTDRTL